jgi:exopolysaccharide biosynthesis polyprenyl glycosylphosphotransferase
MTMPAERSEQSTPPLATGWPGFWPRLRLQTSARHNRRRHAARRSLRLGTLLLLDLAGVLVAMLIMLAVDPSAGWGHAVRWNDPAAGTLSVLAQHVLAITAGLLLTKAYVLDDAVLEPGRVTLGVALGLLVLHWPMLWHDGSTVLRSYVPSLAVYATTVWLSRRVGERSLRTLFPSVAEPARALFVGSLDEIESAMQRSPLKGPHAIVRVAELDLSHVARNGNGRTRTLESRLQAAIHDHDVDTTVLCSQFTDEELSQLVVTSEAAGCRVISVSRTYEVSRRRPAVRSYGDTPIVELTQPGIRGRDVVLKRVFDLVTSSVLLVLLAPVLLIVAVLVKFSSPGPALFRQERVGYGGRRFHILKFRTMCANAEEQLESLRSESIYQDDRLFKIVDDPRVTPLGRFLRRSSLDELPQLFNVLGGSMSLVGPRPPLPREVKQYGRHSFLRFDVKPGITGPWQVNGRNRITSFDEVIALEAEYVSGWTIWRDFAILVRTVPVVLRMDGAH